MKRRNSDDWYVPTLASGLLPGIPPVTINDPQNYVYHNITPHDLATRQSYSRQMTGSKLENFSPERLALHEAIVQLSINTRIKDEEGFQARCTALMEMTVANMQRNQFAINKTDTEREVEELITRFKTNENDPDVKLLRDWKTALESHRSNDALSYEQKVKILGDSLYDKILLEKNALTVRELVGRNYDSEDFQKDLLTLYGPEQRQALLVVGGAASGKGSVTELTKTFILHDDAVEINPDLYKKLVLPDSKIGGAFDQAQTRIHHGSLTHEESGIIFDKIAFRWRDMAKHGSAPNLLIDVCRPSDWAMGIASSGHTKVEIHAATVDTEIALQRSYRRGEKTGRFMPTQGLLQGHKDQLAAQSNAMNKWHCPVIIYDTNNPRDVPPKLVMASNPDEHKVHILDSKAAIDFFAKANLNPEATNTADLYSDLGPGTLVSNMQNYAGDFSVELYSDKADDNEQSIATIKDGNLEIKNIQFEAFCDMLQNDKAIDQIFQGIESNAGRMTCDNKEIEAFLNRKYSKAQMLPHTHKQNRQR